MSIDKAKLEYLIAERVRMGQPDSQVLREALASELVQRELLMQEAKRRGLDRQSATLVQQEIASDRILAGAFVSQFINENPVSDEAVKKEYDDFIKRAGSEEVLIRQVLLPTLEDAKGVLTRIVAGEKFEEVAAKVSRDGASRQQGGLTGWAPTNFLQPKIADAVKGLSKGSLVKEAVQTPAGWHVIRLEDRRAYTKPSLEAARGQIRQNLQQRALDEYVKSLLAKVQSKN
ncbi:MAG: peptidylprolyl isomerase [Betaproteobacteria bacterium]